MVFVYDLWFVLIKLNIQKNMSFPIPHSSFLIPHSSFPIPHSSFLTPHSSLLYHSTNNSYKSQHNQHSTCYFIQSLKSFFFKQFSTHHINQQRQCQPPNRCTNQYRAHTYDTQKWLAWVYDIESSKQSNKQEYNHRIAKAKPKRSDVIAKQVTL